MGSWSESCAVSGMEIREGDECYVALVVPHQYGEDQPVVYVPPIKGVYADYGSIDLLECNTRFGLVKGKNWSPQDVADSSEDHDDEEDENSAAPMQGRPLYIQASIFEFLSSLVPEYAYYNSDKVKNIGEIRDRAITSLRKKMAESVEQSRRYAEIDPDDSSNHDLLPVYLGNVFGVGNDIQANMVNYAGDIVRNGANDEDLNELFEFYGRSLILIRGLSELRKIAVPGIRGPQHDGEIALIQFYQFVLDDAKQRKAEMDALAAAEDAAIDVETANG